VCSVQCVVCSQCSIIFSLIDSSRMATGGDASTPQKQQTNHRTFVKEATTKTRSSGIERRNRFTTELRKSKRSQLVAQKRRCLEGDGGNSGGATTKAQDSLEGLVSRFISSNNSREELLSILQGTLSSPDETVVHAANALLNHDNRKHLVLPLLELLSKYLLLDLHGECPVNASRILTNLAACAASTSASVSPGYDASCKQEEDMSMYGPAASVLAPERTFRCWSEAIVHSSAFPALVSILAAVPTAVPAGLKSYEQCVWALGNLAGDITSTVRQKILEYRHSNGNGEGVIQLLVNALRGGFTSRNVNLCRNAAWALSNLMRGADVSATLFVDSDSKVGLLNPNELAEYLLSPATLGLSWGVLSTEVCWMVAFLSAREDTVVDYLCNGNDKTKPSFFCHAVNYSLARSITSLLQCGSLSEDNDSSKGGSSSAIPCIRAIGNIATSSNGQHVPLLLTSLTQNCATAAVSIGSLLVAVAHQNTPFSTLATVAVEASWAASALLADAGTPNHPSTTISCPALLTPLCTILISQSSKLDLKREAAIALLNAAIAPPQQDIPATTITQHQPVLTGNTNQDIVLGISQFQNNKDVMINLVQILNSPDVEAIFGSLRLINLILQSTSNADNNSTCLQFEEAGGLDCLDSIFDRASAAVPASRFDSEQWDTDKSSKQHSILEQCADIASNIIDTFFDDNEEPIDDLQSNDVDNNNALFSFGVASLPANGFHFGNNNQNFPVNGIDNSIAGVGSAVIDNGSSMGRGRGRGIMQPAWMTQQQQPFPQAFH